MRTLYLFLFILLNSMYTHNMEKEPFNKKLCVTHLLDTNKETPIQKLSPRSEKAPQRKKSVIPNRRNQDPNPLVRLPNDILSKVLYHASEDNIFNAVKLLIQLNRTCKILRSLQEPNTMKTILNLDQRILSDNLNIYGSHHLMPNQDFTPFLKILVAIGANITRYEDLFVCVSRATNAYLVEQYITHHKPNINAQDEFGNTPLRWTIDLNKPHIMKILLEHGADMCLTNNLKEAPMSIALLHGHVECIKLLIQYKIDTSIEYDWGHDYKMTVAKWAENAKNEEIYKLVTKKDLPKKWYEYLKISL